MLLSARVLTVEEGTHNYGMRVGKKKSYGDILQLDVEVLVRTHDFKNMYVCMFMCTCILYMYECICIFVGGVCVCKYTRIFFLDFSEEAKKQSHATSHEHT